MENISDKEVSNCVSQETEELYKMELSNTDMENISDKEVSNCVSQETEELYKMELSNTVPSQNVQTPRLVSRPTVDLAEAKRKLKCTLCDIKMVSIQDDNYEEDKDYSVVRELGKGSFAVVHLTKDKLLGKESARKKIHKSEYRKEELMAMQDLKDTNISPAPHAIVVTSNECYIFMEIIKGITLQTFLFTIKENDFSQWCKPAALEIFIGFLEAVLEIHRKGWAHGDLHGSNMLLQLVDNKLEFRLIDYGNAEKSKDEESKSKNCSKDFESYFRIFFPTYTCNKAGSSISSGISRKDKLLNFLEEVTKVTKEDLSAFTDEAATLLLSKLKEHIKSNPVPREVIEQMYLVADYQDIHPFNKSSICKRSREPAIQSIEVDQINGETESAQWDQNNSEAESETGQPASQPLEQNQSNGEVKSETGQPASQPLEQNQSNGEAESETGQPASQPLEQNQSNGEAESETGQPASQPLEQNQSNGEAKYGSGQPAIQSIEVEQSDGEAESGSEQSAMQFIVRQCIQQGSLQSNPSSGTRVIVGRTTYHPIPQAGPEP